ncbi:hypothetical protein Dsin_017438 [Dipteronia sinensis]|uniref:TTF-type domain-containing protein n=1 Tax=Dipteronia sinensis TaxID=43782 RepID=A0AAE0AGC4_9ROSI|nr:hypothetical protein Dsin_017438 [Dipteronia sinensis]
MFIPYLAASSMTLHKDSWTCRKASGEILRMASIEVITSYLVEVGVLEGKSPLAALVFVRPVSLKSCGVYDKKDVGESSSRPNAPCDVHTSNTRSPPKTKRSKTQNDDTQTLSHITTTHYERDPEKRIPIRQYPVDKQDEIRRAYVDMGPFQPTYEYPLNPCGSQSSWFQQSWFIKFPWIEYSVENNSAFCFPCNIFDSPTSKYHTFTVESFQNWKRVGRYQCPLAKHAKEDHNSLHHIAMQKWNHLKNPSLYIAKMTNKQSSKVNMQNRLLLKTSIESVKWLAMQGCAFRGNDESINSVNHGNFIEMVMLQARVNKDIAKVVLYNAAQNAKYTSPKIQQELLKILVNSVSDKIRVQIGDVKFCILVDEAVDESNKEQMAIILRYVNDDGFIRNGFLKLYVLMIQAP